MSPIDRTRNQLITDYQTINKKQAEFLKQVTIEKLLLSSM